MNEKENQAYLARLCVKAQEDGFPEVSKFLDRMANGFPLFQIVVEGGVVSDVIGLPKGCAYDLVDFDIIDSGDPGVVVLLRELNPNDTQEMDDEEVLDNARELMENMLWKKGS